MTLIPWCSGASWIRKQILKAVHHILAARAETIGAFKTDFDRVNLRRPTFARADTKPDPQRRRTGTGPGGGGGGVSGVDGGVNCDNVHATARLAHHEPGPCKLRFRFQDLGFRV